MYVYLYCIYYILLLLCFKKKKKKLFFYFYFIILLLINYLFLFYYRKKDFKITDGIQRVYGCNDRLLRSVETERSTSSGNVRGPLPRSFAYTLLCSPRCAIKPKSPRPLLMTRL